MPDSSPMSPGLTFASISQVTAEVLRWPTTPKVQVSQIVVEVLGTTVVSVRVSQVIAEVLYATVVTARIGQITVEVLRPNFDLTVAGRKVPVNTYPTYLQLITSKHTPVDGLSFDRTVAGNARGRSFYPVVKNQFTLQHVLSAADLDSLMVFYEANKTEPVYMQFQRNMKTYNVIFTGPPQHSFYSGDLMAVAVTLSEY